MYVKIFSTILDSSVWLEDGPTRLVWITMLCMADRKGQVRASFGGLAHRARVSREECREALRVLVSPDPESKDQDYGGRRIEPIEGGWLVLNYQKYRELQTEDQRAEAEKKRRQRARHRTESSPDTSGTGGTRPPHTDADAEAEAVTASETTSPAAAPPPVVHTDETDPPWNAILAPIVREAWYADNLPHRDDERGKPWSLARDMSMLKRVCAPRNGKPGRDPAELEPAIRGLRLLPTYKGRAVDARLLTERTVWALSVAAHWEHEGGEKKRRTAGGLGKIVVPARLGGAA